MSDINAHIPPPLSGSLALSLSLSLSLPPCLSLVFVSFLFLSLSFSLSLLFSPLAPYLYPLLTFLLNIVYTDVWIYDI